MISLIHFPRDFDSENIILQAPQNKLSRKSFDDIFMIQAAIDNDGIIVSNDQFKDLWHQATVHANLEWKHVIRYRVLQYTFISDIFEPSCTPLGVEKVETDFERFVNGDFAEFKIKK